MPPPCPSDVAYIGSNSKTKRPRKTKLCTGVPQVTCDSHTDFKVKSQGWAGAYCGGYLAAQLVLMEVIVDPHLAINTEIYSFAEDNPLPQYDVWSMSVTSYHVRESSCS